MDTPQAQAATPTPAAPPSGADNADTSQPNLENASLEQLDSLLSTGKVELPPAPAGSGQEAAPKGEAPTAPATETETPAGEEPPASTETPPAEPAAPTPPEPAATPPAEEPTPPAEPVTPPTEPATPKGEEETPSRFRFNEPTDRAIAAMKKARPDLSWAQAEALVVGDRQTAPTVEDIVEQEPSVLEAAQTVESIRGEITELESRVEEFEKNEDFTADYGKANRELVKKQNDLLRAETTLDKTKESAKTTIATRQAEAQQHRTARQESRKAALGAYPDVADENTALGKAVKQLFEEMKNPNHPDNPILFADSAPEIITERIAKKLGIAPVAKAKPAAPPSVPTAKPTQQAATPARQTVSPPSGGKTSVPVVPPAEDVKKHIEHLQSPEATLEELDAAFDAADPTAVLAAAAR